VVHRDYRDGSLKEVEDARSNITRYEYHASHGYPTAALAARVGLGGSTWGFLGLLRLGPDRQATGLLAPGLRLQEGANGAILTLLSVGIGRFGAEDVRHGPLYL